MPPSACSPRLPPVPALADALDEQARALRKRRVLLMVSGGAAVAALGSEVASQVNQASTGSDILNMRAYALHNVALGLTGASGGIFVVSWSVGR